MKNLAILIIVFTSLSIGAQSLRPGISYTYLFDSTVDLADIGYHESTVNVNLNYEVTPRLNFGIQYLNIVTRGASNNYSDEVNNYYLAGVFMQVDVAPNWKGEVFPELSFSRGNYCTCSQTNDPFKQEGINYVGYGIGLDYPLTKRLFLDTGLYYYRPLTNIDKYDYVYAYGQYLLGLSYKIL